MRENQSPAGSRWRSLRRLGLFVPAAFVAAGIVGAAAPAGAAESGTGVYLLGSRGPGAGLTPPEGWYLSLQTYFYDGRASAGIPLESGKIAAHLRANPVVIIPTLQWVTPIEIGNARLGFSLTAPFGNVDVRGDVGPFSSHDSVFTYGDPAVTAFLGGDLDKFHWQAGVTEFLPIGDYRQGALANISKNRGATDVYGALTWLDPSLGIDVSNAVGVTFNYENAATDYKTGNEFHWEWSATKKFDNGISFGPVGYYYQQLTGDTGDGAKLGDFEGRVWAIGATAAYDFKVGQTPVSARIRYYHEFDTKYRLKGDAAFLSLTLPL